MRKLAAFLVIVAMSSIAYAKDHKHAPLPSKVLTARTVYLDNRTGYEKFSDRAYDELQKWGRFRVVAGAKDADLVFLLSASEYHGGYVTSGTTQQHGTVDDGGNVNICDVPKGQVCATRSEHSIHAEHGNIIQVVIPPA